MEKNIQEDANPNKLKELLEEFYKLERNNMPENRKRLNHYIIKIKQNIRDDQELSAFTKMLKTDDIKQQKLKIEILLQLRRNDQLLHILKETDSISTAKITTNLIFLSDMLHILKETDSISTAKITTNLIFLSDMFSQMECEEFFKNIVPFIPFSATEKIINRLGKVLKDEDLAEEYFEAVRLNYGLHLARRILPRCRIDYLAEEYFEAVRLNYGLHLARRILPRCRIDFAKSIVDGNQLRLTSRELLRFASRDRGFLKFYYDMLGKYDIGVFEVKGYENVIQYVGRTDADLFWQLNPAYKFHYNRFEKCFGKSVFNFLFLNDAAKATNRQNVVRIFKARIVYQVLKRHGKIYILLANFCEGDENEFFKIYFDNDNEEFAFIQVFLNDMPKLAYSELHRAYELKFGKNLLDNTKIFNADWLRTMSSLNRSIVLDILCEENRNLYYLYDLEKSMPLLKEKLTNDVENCEFYLKQMYKSCEFHKSVGVLENVLKNSI
ncbi:hypothetical protein QE152_g36266 [Popillia japonica]|uniref:Uncharacterized protein n=1 Tax=Popillia japonica TaxID=7064 RepID=A0AAW1IDI3_POPJA